MNRLNVILRTYDLENLYNSLFDIPNKASGDLLDICVHNDNPDRKDEFYKIIEEFKTKYPDYSITIIQEEESATYGSLSGNARFSLSAVKGPSTSSKYLLIFIFLFI